MSGGAGQRAAAAAAEIAAIIDRGENPGAATLTGLFDRLEPVRPEAMIGTWRGAAISAGTEAARMLERMRWYGKRFTGPEQVEPLLCLDGSGEIYSYEKLGLARLREVVFRGKLGAAMVYDTQPIIDHFRVIDADRLLGVMDVKGSPADFFFHLRRDRDH